MWSAGPSLPHFSSSMEIHVWRLILPLNYPIQTELYRTLLTEEITRAERFHFPSDRERYAVARAVLKDILARYLRSCPTRINLSYSDYGKPYLKDYPLFFNLSHSKDYILIGISQDKQLGIDVEFCKENNDFLNIAKEFCTPDEYQQLLELSFEQRKIQFYQYWTRKEAVAKGMGQGLSYPLKQIPVNSCEMDLNSNTNRYPSTYSKILINSMGDNFKNDSSWHLFDIDLGDEYAAALAVEDKQEGKPLPFNYPSISFWDWEHSNGNG